MRLSIVAVTRPADRLLFIKCRIKGKTAQGPTLRYPAEKYEFELSLKIEEIVRKIEGSHSCLKKQFKFAFI